MEIAFRMARKHLLNGVGAAEVCQEAKRHASFAGSMRKNLVSMLDTLGLAEWLGISSIASLFTEHRRLLHTTSVIRYPVFVRGRNYTGHNPEMLDTPILRWFVDNLLSEELQRLPQAMVIPLGRSVSTVLEHLVKSQTVERDRCLLGFPHPSGANGHRLRQFDECRPRLTKLLQRQKNRVP
jgi:hypothetical protein